MKLKKSGLGRFRNKPCPCGSGQKGKRCCIKEMEDTERRLNKDA